MTEVLTPATVPPLVPCDCTETGGCDCHVRLTAPERVASLLDPGSAVPLVAPVTTGDPLRFVDTRPYPQRLRAAREETGLAEAVLCVRGTIGGQPVVAAVMDFAFMGGSLGCAAGELITLSAEAALRDRVPLVLVTASGGARMQEGVLALMQMAKTGQALAQLDEAGVLTVAVITDPTYGGVAASFATLCDVLIAEPGARLGFAGRRVIEQTVREQLPPEFQTAEFLLGRGLIDGIRPRPRLRATLARLLCTATGPAEPRRRYGVRLVRDAEALAQGDAWATVRRARNLGRPSTLDYIAGMVTDFEELHGDRLGGDCPAIVGGLGRLDGRPVVVIGHQKGHNAREVSRHNFGMPVPAGYRKAARLMRLAAKLGLPVVTLVDTPGAFPGRAAEEQGQAVAIAENLRLMASLPVPVVTVVTGEGGSGGALALAVSDRVLACENAVYSVISPEGCAAILWKDPNARELAAQALRLDARSLLSLGIVDAVIPEPEGGAHTDPSATVGAVAAAVSQQLDELAGESPARLIVQRRSRFRRYGTFPAE